jgi:bifunctional non-homologous end joining protein LigD
MDLFRLSAANSGRNGSGNARTAGEIAAHNQNPQLQPLFVKKHIAATLHYDLRLGYNGVLISFVLPEGPSYYPGHSRKAIEMDDHRREYAGFEGMIPEGRYGAGVVMLWDRGMWKPCPDYSDVDACLRDGVLKMTFHGERLKGDWTLSRRSGYRRSGLGTVWMFVKEADSFARSKEARSILEEAPNSASTGRSLEEIKHDWVAGKRRRPEPTLF